jgi:VIT1/CCC1 family predicted Fe2+/Mn2+ transporter
MISRNYAAFLLLIGIVVLATPFVNRPDWLGWVTTIVVVGATLAILGVYVGDLVRTAQNWWHDDLE